MRRRGTSNVGRRTKLRGTGAGGGRGARAPTRAARAATAGALLAAGCARAGDPPADARPADSATALAGWTRAAWAPHDGRDAEDRGTGIVFLAAGTTGAAPREDTLLFRAAPARDAPPVAALIVTYTADGGWRHDVAAPGAVAPRLLEHGYEEAGVPTDSTDASGRWVRGVLGLDSAGAPVRGWAELVEGRAERLRWAEHLVGQPLFLLAPSPAAFRASPDGPARPLPVPGASPGTVAGATSDDVAIHPLERRGDWLRARVVAPSDLCVPDDSLPRHETEAWIRYLDERGRPLVWYFTRGC